jgi:hypothetical protein
VAIAFYLSEKNKRKMEKEILQRTKSSRTESPASEYTGRENAILPEIEDVSLLLTCLLLPAGGFGI